nr:MAG TPA: hypothetical protein [Caudoviricetes sp.]
MTFRLQIFHFIYKKLPFRISPLFLTLFLQSSHFSHNPSFFCYTES